MNVSLFTLTVARGAELPAIDPSIAQADALVVTTQDNGPAAQSEASPVTNDSIAQTSHVTNSAGTSPL
jgi:chitodextrinase